MNRQIPALIRQNNGKVPKVYVKAVAELETTMLETIEKQKVTPKKMNATNTRGLNAVRQRVRKLKQDYSSDIEKYKADPEKFMQDEVVEEVVPTPKKKAKVALDAGASAADADDEGFTTVDRTGKAVIYTPEGILKQLRTIVEARGRKNTDRMEQIRTMEKLYDVAVNDYQKIRVLLTSITSRFDLTSGTGNQMAQEQWKLYVYQRDMVNQQNMC